MTHDYPASLSDAQPPRPAVTGLVEAFLVDSAGRATPLPDPRGAKAPAGGYLWVHASLDDGEELVARSLGLPPLVTRSLLASETRPRCQHVMDGVLINLRGINFNEGCRPEDMLSLRCWLEPTRLITVRKRRSVAVEAIRKQYRAGKGHSSAGELLIAIVGGLLDRIEPVVDALSDGLDEQERMAIAKPTSDTLREAIAAVRHDAASYRRYIGPMRDAIRRLGSRTDECFARSDLIEIDEQTDRATRVVEELDITIERASVVVDQMAAARSEQMNRTMMILAVISAIFLPLSFLTGLLGINVGGIPGSDNPLAFPAVVVLCIAIGVTLGAWFRRRNWL